MLITPRGQVGAKIIDFGIAKATDRHLTDKTFYTSLGQMIGTPLYMSPEQAGMSPDLDTRSDIYSLARCFTSFLPDDAVQPGTASGGGLRRDRGLIREEPPLPPSARITTLGAAAAVISAHRKTYAAGLRRLLRRDLDWIVLKALEKDRSHRYQTAAELARDVGHYLAHEPIEARRPSLANRVGKWALRHGRGVVVGLLLLLCTSGLSPGRVDFPERAGWFKRIVTKPRNSTLRAAEKLARPNERKRSANGLANGTSTWRGCGSHRVWEQGQLRPFAGNVDT